MKVLGLVVEYNPFHNGHLYHLEQSIQLSKADYVVCVMSGNFIQRGEPALVNKWARTKMALLSGVDLVVELPAVYAMSSAEYFAYGAVKILNSMGIVDDICFGSENGRIDELNLIADILINEPDQYKVLLKQQLNRGLSYPASREAALRQYLQDNSSLFDDLEALIGSSNNILGIEYLKALKRIGSNITPLTIKRIGNAYNTPHITGSISSATAIRKSINNRSDSLSLESLKMTLPDTSLKILKEEFENGRGPVTPCSFNDILLSSIRLMSRESISQLPYVSEGLENRIKSAAQSSVTLEELIENVSTRRYTKTRIQRSIFSILTGVTAGEAESFMKYGGPQYIRILGFNDKGKFLMSHINKKAMLPVVMRSAAFKNSCNPLLRRMLEIEAFSTDQYVLAYKNIEFRKGGQEYTHSVVRSEAL